MDHPLDEKVEKEDAKCTGEKGKGRESDPSIQEGCPRPELTDFISNMPDNVLAKILSRLPLKQAVTTSILSPRWRFMWHSLKNLDFVGTKNLDTMDQKLCDLERPKYINQVNSVIGSLKNHSSPMVKFSRICFDLDKTYSKDIDNWLRFVLDKKAEVIELDLTETDLEAGRGTKENYDFPLPLSDGSMVHLSERPSSSSMVVETLSFKKLSLSFVNVSDQTLKLLLKNSPNLEMLYIHQSGLLTDIDVGGRDINMKHFTLAGSTEVQFLSLHDFDLEKFHYFGSDTVIRLRNLPKIKEVCIGIVSVGLKNTVFRAISSVASNLEVLNLSIDRRMEDLNVGGIPELPNVKTLKLTIPTEERDSLIAFIEIAKRCRKLETFIVSLHWCMPITRNKTSFAAVGHSFSHLKRLEIDGYRGLVSDFQIALYMIGNAAITLKKVLIVPFLNFADKRILPANECLRREKAGRSHAKSELSQCLPSWVELVVF